jgi:SNF2 family DNA or RNA helicase
VLIAYIHTTKSSHAQHLRVKQTPPFREDLKLKLQRIGSPARWLPDEWAWDTPLQPMSVVRLSEIARECGEQVEWRDGLREYAEQHLKQADYEHEVRLAIEKVIRDGTALDGYVTLTEFHGKHVPPLRHQQIAYQWSQRCRGILLAWDPGTGKTRAAADAAGGWYRTGQIPPMKPAVIDGKPAVSGGVLVVCPRTMTLTWSEELARWQNASSIIIKGTAQRKARLAGMPAHVHIINYESLKFVTQNHYASIILDECHRVANNTSATHNAMTIAERTTKRLGLTGTPVSNDLKSVFYQMLLIDGGRALGPSRTAFLERFFSARKNMGGFVEYDPKDGAGTEVAQAMATSCYFVRKSEVLDLPEKTHTPVYLPMTDEQAKYYRQIKNEALVYIQDATVTLEQASARMAKLLQVCQGFALVDGGDGAGRHFTDVKTETLIDLLTDQLRGKKVIVWANFRYEIHRLDEMLTARGISHMCLNGEITSQTIRDEQMRRWNADDDMHVYVRQMSMSEGVTLLGTKNNPCHTTLYLGLNYRLVDWKQSQDRNHRIGQTLPCSYTYLLTENGVDRKVYNRLLEKGEDADLITSVGKAYYAELLRD